VPLFLTVAGQMAFVTIGRPIEEKDAPALLVFAALAPQALFVTRHIAPDDWQFVFAIVAAGLAVLALMLLGIGMVFTFFPRLLDRTAWFVAGLTILLVIMPAKPPVPIAQRMAPSSLIVPTLPIAARLTVNGEAKVHTVTYRMEPMRYRIRENMCQVMTSTDPSSDNFMAAMECKTRFIRCDDDHAFCVVEGDDDAHGFHYDGTSLYLRPWSPFAGDPSWLRAAAQLLAIGAGFLLLRSRQSTDRPLALKMSALAATGVAFGLVVVRVFNWL
jgi:hypothetical protein